MRASVSSRHPPASRTGDFALAFAEDLAFATDAPDLLARGVVLDVGFVLPGARAEPDVFMLRALLVMVHDRDRVAISLGVRHIG